MSDKTKPGDAPVTTSTRPVVSPELRARRQRDAGRGVSTKAEDRLIPLLYVLQTGSPQVDQRGNNYVQDAEPGDFYLRNALQPIRSGIEGLDVIPCKMLRRWVGWLPQRRGLVAEYEKPPAGTEFRIIKDNSGNDKEIMVQASTGHIIEDTRQFFLRIGGQSYMFPCTGTRHTFAREWQTHFNQLYDEDGNLLPAFAHHYRLTTRPIDWANFRWFGVKFEDLGDVTDMAEYDAAEQLCSNIERGLARIDKTSISDHGDM
jgi:hypothetical protein